MSAYQHYIPVRWRFVPSIATITNPTRRNASRGAIISEGTWGSENTPVVIIADVDADIGQHIVELHNDAVELAA